MACRSAVTLALSLALLLGGCATPTPDTVERLLARVGDTPLLLIGEQHDAPEHQALQQAIVESLARGNQLVAVVMEMVDAGHDTHGLPTSASEAQVREALAWRDAGWPWQTYGPVVMAAVKAGVPVFGGNLPRIAMRTAMIDRSLDQSVSKAVFDQQREGIREAHCDLLPPNQLAPMTRIQLARDRSMAQVATALVQRGKTVLLIAGNGHVRTDLGVPLHLASQLPYRAVVARAGEAARDVPAHAYWDTPALPERDHCAQLHERFKR
ncbi:MAG: ChaN family lipoprotein [Hydrogenophaga sp.]|uniref:ChaN family lipoprotein n=1 Tax=Hydrogenophaga sp. TaxID=1904254 RepID=UPI001D295645|nr:ChaN family lipoprotein [Hydrogenophaga sp.]MBX3609516.1 ChaN family lipoprotein [Hydrogenophaga sp.]